MDDRATIAELERRLAEAQAALRNQAEDAARREADLAALWRVNELNARLANEADLRVRMEEIVEAANNVLGADRGCVQLVSADGERLEMFAYRGYEPTSPFIQHFLHEGSKPACDAARQYGRRLIIEDVATFPGLAGTSDREVGLQEGILATQSTPMITRKGEMVGVLSNQFRTPHRPSEDQLRLIDLLAWNAAEIIERQQTESALRKSEQRLQRVLETDALAVLFFDHDGRLTGANDVFLRMTGYSRAEVTGGGLTWERMTPREWVAVSQTQMERLRTEGRIGPYEKEYLRKDGSRAWMLFAGRDIGDGAIVEIGVEITDRKRAEAALQDSEERFRVLAESIEDVFYVTDLERGALEYLSPSYERVWGRPSQELLRDLSGFIATIHPDDRPRVQGEKAAQMRGEPTEIEYRIIRPDGSVRWILDRSFPVPGRESRRSAGVASDITARKHAEQALRESEARLAAAFQSVPVGVALIDLHGKAVLSNPEYRRFLPNGLIPSRDPDRGDRWRAWDPQGMPIHPDDFPSARALRGEAVVPGLEMLYTEDGGREIWTSVATAPTRDDEGHVTGGISVIQDVDAARRGAEALRASEAERRSLIAQMNEGFCILEVVLDAAGNGVDYRFLETNAAFVRHGGFDPAGRLMSEIAPIEPVWPAAYGRVATTGVPERIVDTAAAFGRTYEVYAFRVGAPADRRIAVFFTDITARTQAEVALRESEAKYRTLFENMTEGYAIGELLRDARGKAVDWRFIEFNPALERHTGMDREASTGRWMNDLFPGADRTYWLEVYQSVVDLQVVRDFEDYWPPLDRWIGGTAWPAEDGRFYIVYRNVTDRKRQELALRESGERLAADLADTRALQDAGAAMIEDRREDEAEVRILAAAKSIMRADAASLQRLDPASGELELLGHVGFHPDSAAFWRRVSDAGGGTCGQAMSRRARVVVEDILQDEIVRASEDLRYYQLSGIVAVQTTPLITRSGRLIGMMSTHWRERHLPGEREFGFFDVLARQAADLIERRDTEAALRESEERFRQFGEASQDVLWIRDAERLQWQYLTPAFETIYGLRRAEALSGDNFRNWLDLIVPEDRDAALAAIGRVRAGEHVTFDYRVRRPSDGAIRWLRNTDFPITNAAGEITLIGGVGHDATELREVEQRLHVLTEGIPQLVWRSRDGGDWTWSGPQWLAFTGQNQEASCGRGWLEAVHPEDRDAAVAAWKEAQARGMLDVEYRVRRATDGEWLWHHTRSLPVHEGGVIVEWLGTSTDIHELRELQERQKVLVAELQHRTRNLIGMIRSTAEKTTRASTDLPDFRARFRDRLDALARVQGLLSRLGEHDRVTFDELIGAELSALDGAAERVAVAGPQGVRLRSSMVQTLAMALHELATNAVKYGALGQPTGMLTITWALEKSDEDGRPWLHIDWRESGVAMPPPGSRPQGTGQGRELIERALPYQLSARTTYTLGPEGVHCTIKVPVSTSIAPEGDPHV